MYREYFCLKSSPFHNTPDPDFLFESRSHKETLASMAYGVLEGKGFVLVTGDVGSGKTLLAQALKRAVGDKHVLIEIQNPWVSAEEVQAAVRDAVGLSSAVGVNQWDALRKRLTAIADDGRRVILIIDEAHQLPERTLEGICLLSNIETPTTKLLQIVLIGQPELGVMLGGNSLRQLQQRISLRAYLEKLTETETAQYIRHRMLVAGGSPYLFPPECVELIYKESNGIPRLINLLCDKCLLFAYGRHSDAVTVESTLDAIKAQRLGRMVSPVPNAEAIATAKPLNQPLATPVRPAPEPVPEPAAPPAAPVAVPSLGQMPVLEPEETPRIDEEPEDLFPQPEVQEVVKPSRLVQEPRLRSIKSSAKRILLILLVGAVLGVVIVRYVEEGLSGLSLPTKKAAPTAAQPGAQPEPPPVVPIPVAPPEPAMAPMPAPVAAPIPAAPPLPAEGLPGMQPQPMMVPAVPAAPAAVAPAAAPVVPAPVMAPVAPLPPPLPGSIPNSLKMREETTSAIGQISAFSTRQYGDWNETTRDLLIAVNPGLANSQSLPPGTKILIPIITRDSLVVKDAQGKFYVYFASFDKPEAAKTNLESVKRNFSNAELFTVDQRGAQVHRLYVGPFATKADAQAVASSVWFKYLPLLN